MRNKRSRRQRGQAGDRLAAIGIRKADLTFFFLLQSFNTSLRPLQAKRVEISCVHSGCFQCIGHLIEITVKPHTVYL